MLLFLSPSLVEIMMERQKKNKTKNSKNASAFCLIAKYHIHGVWCIFLNDAVARGKYEISEEEYMDNSR